MEASSPSIYLLTFPPKIQGSALLTSQNVVIFLFVRIQINLQVEFVCAQNGLVDMLLNSRDQIK